MDYAAIMPKYVVVRALMAEFGTCIYADRLPPRDTTFTNTPFAAVVHDISDATTAEGCATEARRALIQVTAYQRCESCQAGILNIWLERIAQIAKTLNGYCRDGLRIATVTRRNSRPIESDIPEIRARMITLAVDYSLTL